MVVKFALLVRRSNGSVVKPIKRSQKNCGGYVFVPWRNFGGRHKPVNPKLGPADPDGMDSDSVLSYFRRKFMQAVQCCNFLLHAQCYQPEK